MTSHRAIYLTAVLIAFATFAAYANSLTGAFVFDDQGSIIDNPTLAHWPSALLHPPADHGQTVGGRPILNLSFALNYAYSQLNPRSYHVVNILIHLANTLLLFGLVRRTIEHRASKQENHDLHPLLIAATVALAWSLHPLLTSAVTYIVQRAESLCALFYLLTLYAFLRAVTENGRISIVWRILAVTACALGMATKEVMVTAPLVVLLFDRAFVAGSWRDTFKQHGKLLGAIAATWALLSYLVAHNSVRAGSVGFNSGITWQSYGLTQIGAVVHYLQLTFWPFPLIFDYGTPVVQHFESVQLQAGILAVLLIVSLVGLLKNRLWGFLGAAFFLILLPSSSVLPVATQTIAEHRFYLPLAAIVVGVVLVLYRTLSGMGLIIVCGFALAAGSVTKARNDDYRSALTLWEDTAAKQPDNARAQLNAGVQLALANQSELALTRFKKAIQVTPNDSDAHNNFANSLKKAGHLDEAIEQYGEAVRLGPRSEKARMNYGRSLAARGRWKEAGEQFSAADQIEPSTEAQIEVAHTRVALGQLPDAENTYRAILARDPQSAPALTGLGEILARSQHFPEAERTLREALKLDPDSAAAHAHLGNVLLITHRPSEALPEFEASLAIDASSSITYLNMGIALISLQRREDAVKAFEAAQRLDPNNARLKDILARLRPIPR